jgi:putative protease
MSAVANPTIPELLAPAGDWDCVRAAVANGADAVYFGLPRFNARLRAENFSETELPEVVAFCHRHGVKAYVVFNTLVFTAELDDATEYLRLLNRAGVDALIVQDIGLVRLARELTPALPIHASTQMTVTSPEGATFAQDLGVERIVLARELSLRELEKFQQAPATDEQPRPALEVFVHGALCVAYSGQCLTSESLGQRSANRGECAQACRMPYELIVDGAVRDLGDRRYLLSPQDLAAVEEIPALLARGVVSFKIEGRLKTPEYVAAVCQVYRKAIDAAMAEVEGRVSKVEGDSEATPSTLDFRPSTSDRYQLEMTFSRGLFTGWMHGVDHQRLVPARSGKKRGPFAGRVVKVGRDHVEFDSQISLAPGDGVVFDTGGDTNAEQGGRIYEIHGHRFYFAHGHLDFAKLKPGDRVWKTDDPALGKRLRQSFSGRIEPRQRIAVDIHVSGRAGEPLVVEAVAHEGVDGTRGTIRACSTIPLQAARTAPLTLERLRDHLGRLSESAYALGELTNGLAGEVILPIAELNRLRRELVLALDAARRQARAEVAITWREMLARSGVEDEILRPLQLRVLCRTPEQLAAALAADITEVYVDYEDIRRYADAVAQVRAAGTGAQVFLATPRIQKAGEQGFFRLIENAQPDGVLIRNLGAIDHFRGHSALRKVGDFSLNVANPLTAQHFIGKELERVTVSYDLNAAQVLDLLGAAPAHWFELTLHQHMPMFHMEHCVFAAFLSKGSSFLDCGRPCDHHRVHLRDRVGMEHPLRADVGCRNTLFNAVAQTGARFFRELTAAGLRDFRIELLEEDAAASVKTIRAYQALVAGERDGEDLLRELNARSQLGVTQGTLA